MTVLSSLPKLLVRVSHFNFHSELKFALIITAPSSAPTVTVQNVTSLNVTVQWEPLSCVDINGDLTGYLVRHRMVGSDNSREELVSILTTVVILTDLTPSSIYYIEVAAINTVGIGVFGAPVTVTTLSSKLSSPLARGIGFDIGVLYNYEHLQHT